jgi:hypothetical protein
MEKLAQFRPGDRVRVDSDYWDSKLAGRTGTVAKIPAGVRVQEGCRWVDLDVPQWKPGVIDGVEIEATNLKKL